MAWLVLGIAGVLEIAFALCMKASEGFTRLTPALLTVAAGLSSVVLLSTALRTLPVGPAMRSGRGSAPQAPPYWESCCSAIQPRRRGSCASRSFWRGVIDLKLVTANWGQIGSSVVDLISDSATVELIS